MKNFMLLQGALLFVAAVPDLLLAGTATFGWSPNTETDLAGYRIYYGPAPRQYDKSVDCGNVTKFTVENVPDGMTYYAATAYDLRGNESDYSTEVGYDPPPMTPGGLIVQKATITFEFAPAVVP